MKRTRFKKIFFFLCFIYGQMSCMQKKYRLIKPIFFLQYSSSINVNEIAGLQAKKILDFSDKDFIQCMKHDTNHDIWKELYLQKDCLVRKFLKYENHFDNDLLKKNINYILDNEKGNLALLVWCIQDMKHAYKIIGLNGIHKLYHGLFHTVNKEILKKYYDAAYEEGEISQPFEDDFLLEQCDTNDYDPELQ